MESFPSYNIDPHDFPNISNINVDKTKTIFDYNLWGANTNLYLKHVSAIWGSDGKNTVKFANKVSRDTYFKSNPAILLTTEFRIPHNGVIRLPIPYDNLINFNYILASYPNAPVINYNSNNARKDYFYFIEDCKYIGPNCTEVIIKLDVWTTYIDDISISNLQLKRGHYPVKMNNIDNYLSNPLNNNIGLLAVDINFGEISKIASSEFINFNDVLGDKWIGIITTADIENGSWTDNVETSFSTNNPDVNHLNANNNNVFFVNIVDFKALCIGINNSLPQFFQTIQAIFRCSSKFAVLYPSDNFLFPGTNITCYGGANAVAMVNLTNSLFLNKSLFNYPLKYAELAKLYTSPYAEIEITNNALKDTKVVKVEDISSNSIDIYKQVSFNLPFIGIRSFIQNINGVDAVDYGYGGNMKSDWQDYCFDEEFARYAMFLNGNKDYMFKSKFNRIQQQNSINVGYESSNRSNVASKTSGDASASTGKISGDASAATGKTISDSSANLGSVISARGNNQSVDFSTHDINTGIEILATNIDSNKHLSMGNMLSQQFSAWNNLNNENTSFASKGTGTIAGMLNTAITGVAGAGLNPSSIPAVSAGIVNQSYNFITAETMFDVVSNMINVNLSNGLALQNSISGSYEPHDWIVASANKSITVHTEANEGRINMTSKTNFDTNKINSIYKRDNVFAIAEQNRLASLNLALLNNDRSYDQNIANNLRGYNQTIANNQRGYDVNNVNNLAGKNNSEEGILNAIKQSKLNNNLQIGNFTNDMIDMQNKRGIVIKVKKQPDDVVKRTGDFFLRYGYAYDSNVDFTTWLVMNKFSYWEVNDIWMSSDVVNNNIINELKIMLMNGVTIWSNPDEVGKVTIYDN